MVAFGPCFFVVDFCSARIFNVGMEVSLSEGFTIGSSIIAVSVGAYVEMSVVDTSDGDAVGSFDDGLELGLLNGFEEELEEGLLCGLLNGLLDRFDDGLELGIDFVGNLLGLAVVGNSLGLLVGVTMGICVRVDVVGDLLGLVVGLSVGD